MFVHFMCAMQNAQIVQCCAFACKIPLPLPSHPLPTVGPNARAILLQDAFGLGLMCLFANAIHFGLAIAVRGPASNERVRLLSLTPTLP